MNSQNEEIEKNYVDFVVKMRILFEEICKFGEKTNNPISPDQMKSFYEITNELDSQEEKRVRDEIILHQKEILTGLKNKSYNEVIKLPESKKKPSQNAITNDTKNNQIKNQTQVETSPNRNNIAKTDTTVDSNRNIPTQAQINVKKTNQNPKHNRIIIGSSSNLKDPSDSTNNSDIMEDKKSKHAALSNFKPKSTEGEIIMESQEKRSCCKLNNCSII